MTAGRIKGNGFSLQVNHWDAFKGGILHQEKLKVSASLTNLPLVCWNSHAVEAIVSSFGLPHRLSRSSLKWKDLTSFDLELLCDDVDDIPEYVNVIVGPFTYNVQVKINFVSVLASSSTTSEESSGNNDGDWNFWFGSRERPPCPDNRKRPTRQPESAHPSRQTTSPRMESQELTRPSHCLLSFRHPRPRGDWSSLCLLAEYLQESSLCMARSLC